jgi:hypothetical protein
MTMAFRPEPIRYVDFAPTIVDATPVPVSLEDDLFSFLWDELPTHDDHPDSP